MIALAGCHKLPYAEAVFQGQVECGHYWQLFFFFRSSKDCRDLYIRCCDEMKAPHLGIPWPSSGHRR